MRIGAIGLIIAISSSCGEAGEPEIQFEPMEISGNVALTNELGGSVQEASGVTVAAIGSIHGMQASTDTDAMGNYLLAGLRDDIYNVTFSKPGYGTRDTLIMHPQVISSKILTQRSSARVSAVEARIEPCFLSGKDCIAMMLSTENFYVDGAERRIFRYFVSSDPETSSDRYTSTAGFDIGYNLDSLETIDGVTLQRVGGLPFDPINGDTLYLAVYGATENIEQAACGLNASGNKAYCDLSETFVRTIIPLTSN